MSEDKIVWSDELGDLRKKNSSTKEIHVDESQLQLSIRRLTSGKGRAVIEITGLPSNKSWCKNLAKELKKKLAGWLIPENQRKGKRKACEKRE